jgi:branched-chain amino acid aminotransferase
VTAADRRIWIEGRLVPWADATLHVLSQSAQRGSLVFDVMSCHWLEQGPFVFGLRPHLLRFLNSASLSGMQLGLGLDGLLAGVSEAVHANPGCEMVKLSGYYPGVSVDVLPRDARATVAIAAFSLADLGIVRPPGGGLAPARLRIAEPRKMPAWVMSPQAKLAAGYLYTSVAKADARRAGLDDVLLLDERGDLAESSTQSFLLVEGGALRAAPLDTVLASITRSAVLELAAELGIPAREAPLPRAALERAEEAFLCGTSVNVWPVQSVDARRFAPVPGPVTAKLASALRRLLAGEDAKLGPRWLERV